MNVYLALLNPNDYSEEDRWVVVVAPGEDQARSLIWENYEHFLPRPSGLDGDERRRARWRALQEEIVLHKVDTSVPMAKQLDAY